MKLAECLLQEKSIRHESHRDKGIWFVPKIKKYGDKLHIATADLYNLHTLSAEDFASDDWEIKQEPIKVEFTAEIKEVNGWFVMFNLAVSFLVIKELVDSGKRFKVTCEEIEG